MSCCGRGSRTPGGITSGSLGPQRGPESSESNPHPPPLLRKLREALARGPSSRLLDCFYCLSLWIAAPVAWLLGSGLEHRLFLWLALSAGAILIERVTNREDVAPALYFEEEVEDELLRTRVEDSRRNQMSAAPRPSTPRLRLSE